MLLYRFRQWFGRWFVTGNRQGIAKRSALVGLADWQEVEELVGLGRKRG